MFLVSNFPHVPLTTSNAPTDSAAREQQLRPPLPPPEPLMKTAAERAIDPKNERSLFSQIEALDGETAEQEGGEAEQQPEQQKKRTRPESLKSLLAQAHPTIERPGKRRSRSHVDEPSHLLQLTAEQVEQFGVIIANYYHLRVHPQTPPKLLATT
ncbi:MAG: hypothetical protein R3Y10_02050 [Ferrimonas sp.]